MNKQVKYTKEQVANIIYRFYQFAYDIDYDSEFEIELNGVYFCLCNGYIIVTHIKNKKRKKSTTIGADKDDYGMDIYDESKILDLISYHWKKLKLGGKDE